MKPFQILTILIALVGTAGAVLARPIPGPKGGRILTTAAPYAEFFVEKDGDLPGRAVKLPVGRSDLWLIRGLRRDPAD